MGEGVLILLVAVADVLLVPRMSTQTCARLKNRAIGTHSWIPRIELCEGNIVFRGDGITFIVSLDEVKYITGFSHPRQDGSWCGYIVSSCAGEEGRCK